MDFSEYLRLKRINPTSFEKLEEEKFRELKSIFDQMHPDNFTQQKLFLINPLRRKYPLKGEEETIKAKPKPLRPNPDSYRDAKPNI